MTVVAYASAAPDPHLAQSDVVVDLAATPLPIAEVQLYGAGVDSENPGGLFTYSWTILQQPPGPAAALDNTALQNPKIQALQTWGNYRLFLVVTNSVTGLTSETNPLKAPDSAFVHVRLKSAAKGLQKPAPGERNWHDEVWTLIEKVEAAAGVGAHAINDHTDAGATTGAELQQLRGGGYANNPVGGGVMHKHKGADLDAATSAVRGAVRLENAPLDAANPQVVNEERIILQGTADGTQVAAEGYRPGVIVPRDYQHEGAPVAHGRWHAIWYVKEKVHITNWSVVLINGGSVGPAKPYVFDLYTGTAEDVTGDAMIALNVSLTGFPAALEAPLILTKANLDVVLNPGTFLAVVCTQAPREVDGDSPGGGLSVTVHCRRRAGE